MKRKVCLGFLLLIMSPFLLWGEKKENLFEYSEYLLLKTVEDPREIDIKWIQIHANETEALKTMFWALERFGGYSYQVINHKKWPQREIKDQVEGKRFYYDPNRIFSDKGINETLLFYNAIFFQKKKKTQKLKKKAAEKLKKIQKFFLEKLDFDPEVYLIALHNNMNKTEFSLEKYLKKPYSLFYQVYQNENENPKNFFIVVEENAFMFFKSRKENVIWLQKADEKMDEGSLGFYCKKNGFPYLNIETRFGDFEKQKKMVEEAVFFIYSQKIQKQIKRIKSLMFF